MKQDSIIPLLKFDHTGCPFNIQTIRDVAGQQDELNESVHSHDYYEVVWIIKGKGVLLIDMEEHPIDNNTIFFVKPYQAHRFPLDASMEGYVFSFTDVFFNLGEHEFDISCQSLLYQLFNERTPVYVQAAIEEEIRDLSLKMVKEYQNQYAFKTLLLKRYFRIFLILVSRQLEEKFEKSGEISRETELVKHFMGSLDKNFREEKMVSAYASQLYVTANYLNRIVKKHTGYSAGHHIRQRIVLEAKRMGRFSDSGMKEIAYELGFLDSAHFSRFFKSFAGTNFSDFKKETFNFLIGNSFNRA